MTKEQRIEVLAFLAALVCAVTFAAAAPISSGHTSRVLDSGAWVSR